MNQDIREVVINDRRGQVAELLYRGLTYEEIVRNVVVQGKSFDRSTIKRDIQWIKKNQASWWEKNGTVRERLGHYFKHELDTINSALKRAWEQYDKANDRDQVQAAIRALNVIAVFISQQCQLLGLVGGNLNEIEGRESLERFEKAVESVPELKTNAASNKKKTR
jgi:hypothetical protein